jgi:uncharacterized protein YjiS (DUF1127 family)
MRLAMADATQVPSFKSSAGGGWLASAAEALQGWRERRRLAAELAALSECGELKAVLADAGIDGGRLAILLRAGGRPLDAMADRAGVDLAALPPAIRRDAEWTCAICTERKACRRWLRSTASQGPAAFCPNAPVFRRQRRIAAVADAARQASSFIR